MQEIEEESKGGQPIGHMARKALEQESLIQEKSEIEQEMLIMAKGMKQYAFSFKDQFQKDEKVMQQISNSQDDNMSKTTAERDKLANMQKSSVSSFFQKLFMLLLATAVFGFMFIFIWMFPNKVQVQQAIPE
jgi:hypothetical protein